MKKGFAAWYRNKMERLNGWDMAMVKLAVAGFVLLVAKFWSNILSLDWYWYLLLFIVPYAWVLFKMFVHIRIMPE